MTRVCGHLPSPDELRTWHPLAKLLGGDRVAAGPATTGVDRSDLITYVENQEGHLRGSCVWQARTRAVELVAAAAGTPIARRSVEFGYDLTRMLERANPEAPLLDEGCTPAMAAIVAANWGMPPASVDSMIADGDEPGASVLIAAAAHTLDGEYVIDGDDRARGIATALDVNHFATLAVLVDEGFDNTSGVTPVGLPFGKTRGWHDVCAIGYVAVNGVVVAVKIINSWSEQWGDRGFAWISAERVNHSTTRSVQCFVAKPR